MKQPLRLRFWLEAATAAVTGILFVVTLLWENWIELVFGVEPDAGSGALEWLIVAVLLAATLALAGLARREWRRAQAAGI